jgi:hypothetical protein
MMNVAEFEIRIFKLIIDKYQEGISDAVSHVWYLLHNYLLQFIVMKDLQSPL